MKSSKKFFDFELSVFMNFKGLTFFNYTIGSMGQKCYSFLYSDEAIDKLNENLQGSFIMGIIEPTNSSPFSFKKINDNELIIIDWSCANYVWRN